MISITCTNCQAQLTIDDAFAGGVCRCQFCGAIQTVPSRNARPVRATAPQLNAVAGVVTGGGVQKTLYTKKSQPAGSGTGLNDLAEVVASSGLSGLSGSGLGGGHNRRKPPATDVPAASNKLVPILIGAGAIILVLVSVLIWMAIRGHPAGTPQSGATGRGNTTTGTVAASPSGFLGVRLDDPVIIFILDRGQASRSTLDYTKLALLKALGTLRSDQKFQVIFWKTKVPLKFFPPVGPAEVSPAQIESCRTAIDDVVADGTSDVKPAIEKAMQADPSAIVIATGKPLDDAFVKTVLDARKNSKVKIHCLSLDELNSAGPMRQVASKTGGTYRNVEKPELVSASR